MCFGTSSITLFLVISTFFVGKLFLLLPVGVLLQHSSQDRQPARSGAGPALPLEAVWGHVRQEDVSHFPEDDRQLRRWVPQGRECKKSCVFYSSVVLVFFLTRFGCGLVVVWHLSVLTSFAVTLHANFDEWRHHYVSFPISFSFFPPLFTHRCSTLISVTIHGSALLCGLVPPPASPITSRCAMIVATAWTCIPLLRVTLLLWWVLFFLFPVGVPYVRAWICVFALATWLLQITSFR